MDMIANPLTQSLCPEIVLSTLPAFQSLIVLSADPMISELIY